MIGQCDSSAAFKRISDNVATMIEGPVLLSIATKLFSKSIITDIEYDVIIDPSAEHSTAVTLAVLKAVRIAIASDPKNLEKFKGVLLDEGEPISSLAHKIGKRVDILSTIVYSNIMHK